MPFDTLWGFSCDWYIFMVYSADNCINHLVQTVQAATVLSKHLSVCMSIEI